MTHQDFFNRYQFNIRTDKIGGGSFGTVYKAYDDTLDKTVAIKVSEVKIMGGKEFSLKDEFAAIRNLPPHKNIANYESLYTFEMHNGVFDYALMQFYPDGNLSDLIKQNLSFEQKEAIVLGVLNGINHLHHHKIVHRDLKPSNILISKNKNHFTPKITDFGLSKKVNPNDQSRFSNSFGGGTLQYSSPEQLDGKVLRFNTDLWALGVIIYEIFTQKKLFELESNTTNSAKKEKDIYDQIISSDFYPRLNELPTKWKQFTLRCLERNPGKRIKNITEIISIIPEIEQKKHQNNSKNSNNSSETSSDQYKSNTYVEETKPESQDDSKTYYENNKANNISSNDARNGSVNVVSQRERDVNTFMAINGEKFPVEYSINIQNELKKLDDKTFNYIKYFQFKEPNKLMIIAWIGGIIGLDRFQLDQPAIGVLKLLTGWMTLGIWLIVDIATAIKRTKQYNHVKLLEIINKNNSINN